MFSVVKRYFDLGIYNNADVAKFVRAGRLTEQEYEAITGQEYVV